jgi:hypothetical protein
MRTAIGVDLGSRFTKVAVRRALHRDSLDGWERVAGDEKVTTYLGKTMAVDLDDGVLLGETFTTPTAIARREADGSWLFGPAAFQAPSEGYERFVDWKARWFSDAGPPDEVLREALIGFLGWLRDEVVRAGRLDDADDAVTEICGPKLSTAPERLTLLSAAARAGRWPNPVRTCFEPQANTYGVFSHGRNGVYFERSRTTPHVTYGWTLSGSRLFETWRSDAKGTRDLRPYRAVVIDTGAFTVDVGLVTFFDTEREPIIEHWSYARGVSPGLDEPLRAALVERDGIRLDGHASADFEKAKRSLFGLDGRTTDLLLEGKRYRVGTPEHIELARPLIDNYANEIAQLCRQHLSPTPQEVVLTGGGFRIARLRDSFITLVGLPPGIVSTPANEDLVRTASALGAASVLLSDTRR